MLTYITQTPTSHGTTTAYPVSLRHE